MNPFNPNNSSNSSNSSKSKSSELSDSESTKTEELDQVFYRENNNSYNNNNMEQFEVESIDDPKKKLLQKLNKNDLKKKKIIIIIFFFSFLSTLLIASIYGIWFFILDNYDSTKEINTKLLNNDLKNYINNFDFNKKFNDKFKNNSLSINNLNYKNNYLINNFTNILYKDEKKKIFFLIDYYKISILKDYYEACLNTDNNFLAISYFDNIFHNYYTKNNIDDYIKEEIHYINQYGLKYGIFFYPYYDVEKKELLLKTPNLFLNFFNSDNNKFILNILNNNKNKTDEFINNIKNIMLEVANSYEINTIALVNFIIDFEYNILFNFNNNSNKIENINSTNTFISDFIKLYENNEKDLIYLNTNEEYFNYINQNFNSTNIDTETLTLIKKYFRLKNYFINFLNLPTNQINLIINYNNIFYQLIGYNNVTYDLSTENNCINFIYENLYFIYNNYISYSIYNKYEEKNINNEIFIDIFNNTKNNFIKLLNENKIIKQDTLKILLNVNINLENKEFWLNDINMLNSIKLYSNTNNQFILNNFDNSLFLSSIKFRNHKTINKYYLYLNKNDLNLYLSPLFINYFLEYNLNYFEKLELNYIYILEIIDIIEEYEKELIFTEENKLFYFEELVNVKINNEDKKYVEKILKQQNITFKQFLNLIQYKFL